MNHSGDTNKMVGETPRTTDRVVFIDGNPWVNAPFAVNLELELKAANDRIKRLEVAIQERDKEWFQVIQSILGFHPVSMTEALRIGIERIKKQKQLIKRLKEAGDAMMSEPLEYTYEQWLKVRGSKP